MFIQKSFQWIGSQASAWDTQWLLGLSVLQWQKWTGLYCCCFKERNKNTGIPIFLKHYQAVGLISHELRMWPGGRLWQKQGDWRCERSSQETALADKHWWRYTAALPVDPFSWSCGETAWRATSWAEDHDCVTCHFFGFCGTGTLSANFQITGHATEFLLICFSYCIKNIIKVNVWIKLKI